MGAPSAAGVSVHRSEVGDNSAEARVTTSSASALSSFRTESTASDGSISSPAGTVPAALAALPPADSTDGETTTPLSPYSDMQALLRAEWDMQGPAQIEIMSMMAGILEGLVVPPAHCVYIPVLFIQLYAFAVHGFADTPLCYHRDTCGTPCRSCMPLVSRIATSSPPTS